MRDAISTISINTLSIQARPSWRVQLPHETLATASNLLHRALPPLHARSPPCCEATPSHGRLRAVEDGGRLDSLHLERRLRRHSGDGRVRRQRGEPPLQRLRVVGGEDRGEHRCEEWARGERLAQRVLAPHASTVWRKLILTHALAVAVPKGPGERPGVSTESRRAGVEMSRQCGWSAVECCCTVAPSRGMWPLTWRAAQASG